MLDSPVEKNDNRHRAYCFADHEGQLSELALCLGHALHHAWDMQARMSKATYVVSDCGSDIVDVFGEATGGVCGHVVWRQDASRPLLATLLTTPSVEVSGPA